MSLPTAIFRAYDIRGIAETDLRDDIVRDIGRALGTRVRRAGGRRVALGRDARLSGPRLRAALLEGLLSTGVDVLDLGAIPTPLLYFGVYHLGLDGGVEITGSHNPPEYNGFKMLVGQETLHSDQIQELRGMIEAQDFEVGQGTLSSGNIEDAYVAWVTQNLTLGDRRFRVYVDAGNGIAGLVAKRLYEAMGMEVVGAYLEPDGTFPNHHPDPTIVETLDLMREGMQASACDLALGFDGDGDRLGVVDGEGGILWGDKLLLLFARDILAQEPGATIVSEVKCSQTLFDDIVARGGQAVMWKAGHSLIKSKMKETGALLAGEMSGHIFFKHRFFGFDDALYAGARLLEILSKSEQPLSRLLDDVPLTYATPELRLDCPDDRKFAVVEAIVAQMRERYPVVDIDGVRVQYPDGWGLIRASNTQPVLVLRAESTTPEGRDRIEAELSAIVAEHSRS